MTNLEKDKRKYDLQARLIDYASSIILFTESLVSTMPNIYLSKQLIRSSCAAALNYGEAQASESKKDFIHKMQLCLKELRESQVNLLILRKTNEFNDYEQLNQLISETSSLVAIFTTSIQTARRNKIIESSSKSQS